MRRTESEENDNMKASSFYNKETGGFKIFKLIFVIFLVSAIIGVTTWGIRVLTLPARSATGVAEQVLDPNRIVYTYEWFYQQYHNIQATQSKIYNTQKEVDAYVEGLPADKTSWSYTDRKEYERLNSIVLGLQNIQADQIAQYNARSQMVTRDKFKGWGLPDQIQPVN